jgi:hypothetical protein
LCSKFASQNHIKLIKNAYAELLHLYPELDVVEKSISLTQRRIFLQEAGKGLELVRHWTCAVQLESLGEVLYLTANTVANGEL